MLYSCKKDAAQKGAGTMDGIHEGHRARMKKKLLENGERSLADHELLEVLLYYAIPRRDTNELAHRLLKQFEMMQAMTKQFAGGKMPKSMRRLMGKKGGKGMLGGKMPGLPF